MMGWLWRREWNRWKKDILLQLVVGMVLPLLMVLLYKIKKTTLLMVGRSIFQLPEEILVLFGLAPGTSTGNVFFYLLFPVVFLNIWFAWKGCTRTVKTVYKDEWDGSVFDMCNQFYSRRQLGMAKLLWSLASSLGSYLIWTLFLILLAVLGSSYQVQRSQWCGLLIHLLLLGILVHGMLVAVVFLYAVCRENGIHISGSVDWFVFGTIMLGNLYKVRDIIFLLIRKLGLEGSWIPSVQEAFRWLDRLYWISPLSWLNPYTLRSEHTFLLRCCICIVVLIAASLVGIKKYEKRSL